MKLYLSRNFATKNDYGQDRLPVAKVHFLHKYNGGVKKGQRGEAPRNFWTRSVNEFLLAPRNTCTIITKKTIQVIHFKLQRLQRNWKIRELEN
jgi:hypothetical protein